MFGERYWIIDGVDIWKGGSVKYREVWYSERFYFVGSWVEEARQGLMSCSFWIFKIPGFLLAGLSWVGFVSHSW